MDVPSLARGLRGEETGVARRPIHTIRKGFLAQRIVRAAGKIAQSGSDYLVEGWDESDQAAERPIAPWLYRGEKEPACGAAAGLDAEEDPLLDGGGRVARVHRKSSEKPM